MSNYVSISLDFSAIFHSFLMFVKIHEYSNKIISISDHQVQVLYLKINLIPSLVFKNELILRYEYIFRYTSIL